MLTSMYSANRVIINRSLLSLPLIIVICSICSFASILVDVTYEHLVHAGKTKERRDSAEGLGSSPKILTLQ